MSLIPLGLNLLPVYEDEEEEDLEDHEEDPEAPGRALR